MGYLYTPCMYKLPEPMNVFIPDEVFVDVALSELPEGFNHHKVSNYGRVYDYRRERFCSLSRDSYGYLFIAAAYKGQKMYSRVHRLVLASFGYIPGCEAMLVNHKDGVKYHNWLWNLEWTDCSGNILHAYRTGLKDQKKGEESNIATIDNATARRICELLELGYTNKQISDELGVKREIVETIKYRKAWTFMSNDYNIPEPVTHDNRFTDDDVRNMCNLFSRINMLDGEYKKDYISRVLQECGIPHDRKTIKNAMSIYNRSSFTSISKDYTFG